VVVVTGSPAEGGWAAWVACPQCWIGVVRGWDGAGPCRSGVAPCVGWSRWC